MSGKNVTEALRADADGIAQAASILAAGDLVALPTETVYGLAARADSAEAVAKIYAAKGRPNFNPLIVHVRDIDHASEIAQLDDRARELAEQFWPGPLTLVLPLRPDATVAKAVTAGLPTIALRSPAHPVIRAVLEATNLGLAAPSANRSEHISPTSAAHVVQSLGTACPAVLDGGMGEHGLESSIVALREDTKWSLLRPGPITSEQLQDLLGAPPIAANAHIEAPGQLARHYSPAKPLRLNRSEPVSGDFMIGFGPVAGDVTLSAKGDLNEAAARLYECLHLAEAAPNAGISVAVIQSDGVGAAINDRLRRAASSVS